MSRRTHSAERSVTAPGVTGQTGLTLSLWLLAMLVGEAELLLWLVERAYG